MPDTKKKDVFYVGIKDPIEIRRSILESSKEIVQLLQDFEKFKELREQKAQLKEMLKKDIHSMSGLIKKLRVVLPKTELRVRLEQEHIIPGEEPVEKKSKGKKGKAEKEKAGKAPKKFVEPRKAVTELDKLEEELKKIESKLGSL